MRVAVSEAGEGKLSARRAALIGDTRTAAL
jgi:hypothetical protein